MNYVYPKFSNKEILGFRIGGAGLGNLLFMYSRAFKFAKENNCEFIWPTWKSVKIGPWIRREKDKRLYANLFENNSEYIDGRKKRKLLKTCKKVHEEDFNPNEDNQVVLFDKYVFDYTYFSEYRDEIFKDLINNLQKKNRSAFNFDFSDSVSVHIRLGDFSVASSSQLKNGADNSRIPIKWYVDVIEEIRKAVGRAVKVYVFSDGKDEELKEILSLPNTERLTFKTSIADIIALSRAKLFIASGSTFSAWARFLGGTNSICFENQTKCYNLNKSENFEIEIGSEVTLKSETKEKIKALYGEEK